MKSTPLPILCATDFSARGNLAAKAAAQLAARHGATLVLAHVVARANARSREQARKALDELTERLAPLGAPIEPVLLEGAWPARALLAALRTRLPGLMVMAAASKSHVDRWVLGSVSEQVAQYSPVPTLIVRDPSAFLGGGPLKVLLALDLSSSSDAVLRWARELRRFLPCDFIHAYANLRRPDEDTGRVENPEALQRRLERDVRKKVRDELGDDDAEIVVRPVWGSPEGWLAELAHEKKADLTIVATHQRHGLSRLFHGSVSRALLRTPGLNVACVPATANFRSRDAHIREFRRVLVATDFSELGNAAIPYACGLCAVGGLVRIVHVVPALRRTADARYRNALRRRLSELAPDELGARARPPEIEIIAGADPAAAICAEAERFGADAVCLASHGLGGSRALFGSVAKSILQDIRRPVLIVRRPDA